MGTCVPEVATAVAVPVATTVFTGDGVAVGTDPGAVGDIPDVGFAVTPGGTVLGGVGLSRNGGIIGGRLLSRVPITRANGLGWTICVVSKNQAIPTGGLLPQPNGPSYLRNMPSTVNSMPGRTSCNDCSNPRASRRRLAEIRDQLIPGPVYIKHSGGGSRKYDPVTRISSSW